MFFPLKLAAEPSHSAGGTTTAMKNFFCYITTQHKEFVLIHNVFGRIVMAPREFDMRGFVNNQYTPNFDLLDTFHSLSTPKN